MAQDGGADASPQKRGGIESQSESMFICVPCGLSPFHSSDFAGVRVLHCDNGMNELSDHELLRRYATTGEEAPFTELVRRHLNLVWGAARRTTGDGDSARDVAQLVFVDLARKARHLPAGTVLEGWLYRAACHAAAKQVRTETRRTQRERLAMQDPSLNSSAIDDTRAAELLQPELDAALAHLGEGDRDALILRFLAGHSLAEVGRRLGTTEDTAQKRVARALDRVRTNLEKRGIPAAAGTLAAALTVAGAQAAPAGMAAGISAGALAGAAAGGWGLITALTVMKSKLVIGLVGACAVVVALAYQRQEVRRLAAEATALRNQVAVLRADASAVKAAANSEQTSELIRLRDEHTELLRLRGEVARLRSVGDPANSSRLQQAEARAAQAEAAIAQVKAMDEARQHSANIVNAMKYMGLAAKMYSVDHKGAFPKTLDEMRAELSSNVDALGNFRGGVSVDQIEFFTHDRTFTEEESEMILFREKTPRRMPDGTAERIYCLAEGSVQTITSTQADFSEFERDRKATATNAPKRP